MAQIGEGRVLAANTKCDFCAISCKRLTRARECQHLFSHGPAYDLLRRDEWGGMNSDKKGPEGIPNQRRDAENTENREQADGETLYDYAEFDYRYETYDMKLPEEPAETDRVSEDAWLKFLDRLAIKYGKRRPDHLFLLRERGALTTDEVRRLAPQAKPSQ